MVTQRSRYQYNIYLGPRYLNRGRVAGKGIILSECMHPSGNGTIGFKQT